MVEIHSIEKKRGHYETGLIGILMLCSVLIRFYLADFVKAIATYPDELLYLAIAESIAEGDGLSYSISLAISGFEKFFYPLLLAPAYLVSDRVLSIKLVSLINSCLLSSGVIPVWLLGKKMLSPTAWRIGICAFYLIGSDMTFSMTFMSEILYIPMAIWMIYFLYSIFEYQNRKKIICAVAIGFFLYLMYLTKEIALVFVIAIPVVRIIEYCYVRFDRKCQETLPIKDVLLEIACILIPFVLCHVITQCTLFANMENTYSIDSLIDVESLFQEGKIRYILYAFFYYFCTCVVAVGVLPIIMPLIKFSQMEHNQKRIYTFLLLIIILTAFVVACTISIREDYGTTYQWTPRAHLRYVSYIIWPILIVFLTFNEKKEKSSFSVLIKTLTLIAIFGFILIVFWRGVVDWSVDQTLLTYLCDLPDNLILVFTSFLVLATVIAVIFFDKKRAVVYTLFAICFSCVQMSNNIQKINLYHERYSIHKTALLDALAVNEFISQHESKNFIIVIDDFSDVNTRSLDTYVNQSNAHSVFLTSINEIQQETNAEVPGDHYGIESVDYLIVNRRAPFAIVQDTNEIALSNDYFIIYDMNGALSLPWIRDMTTITGDKNTYVYTPEGYWPFSSNDPGRFTSTGEYALVFGPYITLPAGEYTFKLEYSYEGEQMAPDTVVGYCDIYSSSIDENWGQYVTNFTVSEQIVELGPVKFETEVPVFEVRMFTQAAGVKIERIVIDKLE